jgi:alkanesulfonate monooxygenase SsuD/methylene tetrahydromethanopterin reductase-like flavin-dependent oxidoreductase (luciferase family)
VSLGRRKLADQAGAASGLPSYRALLDRQGLAGVEQTALLGDAQQVADGLRAFAAAGATDVLVSIVDGADSAASIDSEASAERDRTLELLSSLSAGWTHRGLPRK